MHEEGQHYCQKDMGLLNRQCLLNLKPFRKVVKINDYLKDFNIKSRPKKLTTRPKIVASKSRPKNDNIKSSG